MATMIMVRPVSARKSVRTSATEPDLRPVSPMISGVFSPSGVATRASATSSNDVRLTRRGRLVIRIVSLMLAAGVGASLVTFATGSDVSASSSTVTYTVQPGDTLWSIAGRLQPKADRRDTVATLLQINPTAAGGLDAGQALRVPQQ